MSAFEKSVKGPDIKFNYKGVPLGWSESVIRDHSHHGTTNELTNHFQGGFVGSFDVLWSEWSQITDPDPHHPHGMHLR